MTVADIKEYIKKQIEKYDEIPDEYQDAKFKQATADLVIVLGMLDELEPEAKWKHDGSQWENRFICSKCGHKIFEEQQPYCSNCGARMEEEDDTTPTNV